MSSPEDLSNASLLDLFRMEVESQATAMTEALLALERDPSAASRSEELMRSAHSLKGAARIVNRQSAVRLSHAIEECFIHGRPEGKGLPQSLIDQVLRGIDLLRQIARVPEPELEHWETGHRDEIEQLSRAYTASIAGSGSMPPIQTSSVPRSPAPPRAPAPQEYIAAPATPVTAAHYSEAQRTPAKGAESRAMRVTAANLDRLLGLAGESLVASRWLDGFTADLLRLKRQQLEIGSLLSALRESVANIHLNERQQGYLSELCEKSAAFRSTLTTRQEEFDSFDRRFMNLSERLHHEVLGCRMRPFAEGTRGFPRMARDVARALGKEVKLEIVGETTQVDREILERLEAPLGHLLRNAVDHGIESPEERERAGKKREGTARVEARHSGGMLLVEVSDDGRGIHLDALRAAVLRKELTTPEVVSKLGDAELFEFVFLPGFTMRETVTDISGRGVGLDVVKNMAKEVGGTARVSTQFGQGTTFQLCLPLTLSVLRTLLVEIAGEPYAFPLGRIGTVLKVPREKIQSIEGREHFTLGSEQVGLVTARQVLAITEAMPAQAELPVVVLGDTSGRYGVVVDRFLGERELVVRTLDPRLGKVKDISAAALMPDQSLALIVDVDDLLRSVENLVSGGRIARVQREDAPILQKTRKRVLVVDDSLTVRELERKLIGSQGYEVEVAVDGMDGWNALRAGSYDLVITDVDMPRLDGIELVSLIKKDLRLHSLPVVIVSYKDREEDRRRGLEAGADYFLTKGSFQGEALLNAVVALIGEAGE